MRSKCKEKRSEVRIKVTGKKVNHHKKKKSKMFDNTLS